MCKKQRRSTPPLGPGRNTGRPSPSRGRWGTWGRPLSLVPVSCGASVGTGGTTRAPRAEPSHSAPLGSAAARPAQDGAERRLLGQPSGLCPHAWAPLRTRGGRSWESSANICSVSPGPGPEGTGWTGRGGRCGRCQRKQLGPAELPPLRGPAQQAAGPRPRAITGRTGPRLCRHGRGGAGRPPQLSLAGPRLGPGGPGTRPGEQGRGPAQVRLGRAVGGRPHPAARFLTPWPRPLILRSF